MIRIPIQAVPNQTLSITLARQNVQLALRQNGDSVYLDVTANSKSIVRTRVCRDRQRILLDVRYLGFIGDFAFVDTRGGLDPQYYGLDSRFQLFYLAATE